MLLNVDPSLVDWSRAQFALTAMYHWIFVPVTLGILFIIAFMETIYVKTGDPEWKRTTKFWMKLFGINFAIGVATGIILEFEFGTNWSNYSWFVGDIFGAPLAIEGIMAFFMESTFIAVMFFGWNKVSKKFHLASTWLTAIGANLSALWILVANGWMQFPTGMYFNPDTARNEMVNFWDVFLSPVAVNKFLHTITSGYIVASLFVIGISSYFLLRGRESLLAKRSIIIASVFGLISSIAIILTGHGSAVQVAEKQPMKLAAMEGLYKGGTNAELMGFGIITPGKQAFDGKNDYVVKFGFKGMLSYLIAFNKDHYVPGVEDLINGVPEKGILPAQERIDKGKIAVSSLKAYKIAKKNGNTAEARKMLALFNENYKHFGYGFLDKPTDIIPNVQLVFYSFHAMVLLGTFFVFVFLAFFWFSFRNTIEKFRFRKLLYYIALLCIPLSFIASEAGWVVVEVGRQPWVVQDYMPVSAAVTDISSSSVQLTFFIFAVVFTALLIAEVSIMTRQIKIGPTKQEK
ncbi:MAG: cytochrome ubiquinol oxidase subunit I [Bacteroidales bacterium]|nr:cytochrome ubiquinol oxidase subunit I [Bacteroidales bacterium]HOY39244.1 cytochrome ubiquinol oxidase subunit I [Bacteroidales bacterium]HQP04219.1 cytochrome ubiquinol oxidase subunit I [Bacteroidales bacterium]